jgi:hydroxymethylpyrimidine/phosphomethylpyrimidine kinase
MDRRKQDEEKQLRKKYTDAMIKKLLPTAQLEQPNFSEIFSF